MSGRVREGVRMAFRLLRSEGDRALYDVEVVTPEGSGHAARVQVDAAGAAPAVTWADGVGRERRERLGELVVAMGRLILRRQARQKQWPRRLRRWWP